MLFPKKVKHRKWQKGRRRFGGISTRGNNISFGSFGLKAQSNGWLSSRQIEAARKVLVRFCQKGGKMWIRIFPDKPITQKGAEVGMGGGKGAVEYYVAPVKSGRIIFEIDGITKESAMEAFRKAGHKLSVKTKFINK
ncbi:MAG: 50S ribosomal protein L16 [Patescibacteria group bacterium]